MLAKTSFAPYCHQASAESTRGISGLSQALSVPKARGRGVIGMMTSRGWLRGGIDNYAFTESLNIIQIRHCIPMTLSRSLGGRHCVHLNSPFRWTATTLGSRKCAATSNGKSSSHQTRNSKPKWHQDRLKNLGYLRLVLWLLRGTGQAIFVLHQSPHNATSAKP